MAARLGRRVVLDAPVRRIAQSRGGVTRDSDAGTWRAGRVIVARRPDAGRADRLRAGAARAARPAHPADAPGLGDQVRGRLPEAVLARRRASTATATATGRRSASPTTTRRPAASPGVLLGLRGRRGRAPAGRDRAPPPAAGPCWASFARLFGPAAARPRTLIEHNWSDELWTRGCYAGYMPPGRVERLRRRAARPGRPDPLGRDRDLRGLQRLHGRRRALRRARRAREVRRGL